MRAGAMPVRFFIRERAGSDFYFMTILRRKRIAGGFAVDQEALN